MILLVGHSGDPVVGRLEGLLQQAGAATARIDEDSPARYRLAPRICGIRQRVASWCVTGGDCIGERAVAAAFVRRGPAGHARRGRQARWQCALDRLLLGARCHVVNRPTAACGNYSKVHQLIELAAAGFPVPPTLVAADPVPAMKFIVAHQGRVLVKGLSSVRSVPTAVGPDHVGRLERLHDCPAQFQRIESGIDVRLTTIGETAIASVLEASGVWRNHDAMTLLPPDMVRRCIAFVRAQGLVMGGFDLRLEGERVVCFLEMNPNPLITHYETTCAPDLSLRLCQELLMHGACSSDILV